MKRQEDTGQALQAIADRNSFVVGFATGLPHQFHETIPDGTGEFFCEPGGGVSSNAAGGMEFPAAHVSGAATIAFSRIVRSFLFRERGKMDFSFELPSPGWNPDTDFLSEVLAATPARTGTSGA